MGPPALTGNITLDTTAQANTVIQLGQSMNQLILQQQQQQNQVLNQTLLQLATAARIYATTGPSYPTEQLA